MKNHFTSRRLALVFIVLLAFFLRMFRYDYFPVGGETADESAWTMLGSSLIQTGKPASWSYFAPYKDYIVRERGNEGGPKEAPIVSPALDHPPIFSIIPGFFHSLKYNWQNDPSIKLIRLPMVFLGTINVFLVFLVSKKFFKSEKEAFLATILYATAPLFVFSSRLVVAENLLVSFVLITLLQLFSKDRPKRMLWLVGFSVFAVLTKVSGVVVPLTVILSGIALSEKKVWKAGIIGLCVGIGAFFLYGLMFNFHLFWMVQTSQAGRDLGLATIQNRFFLHPTIVSRTFFDGWEILGLFSLFSLLAFKNKERNERVFSLAFVTNIVFIVLSVGETTFHGWYNYVLYPFFAIGITWILTKVMKEKLYVLFGFVWLLLLPLLRMSLLHLGIYEDTSNIILRCISILGFIPFGFQTLKKIKFARVSFICLLLMILSANILTVLKFNQHDYWESDEYFLPSRVVK